MNSGNKKLLELDQDSRRNQRANLIEISEREEREDQNKFQIILI